MQGLNECLALAEYPKVDLANAPAKLKEYDKQIEWAKRKRESLYGFEEIAKGQLKELMDKLAIEKTRLQNHVNHEGLARLSMEPLKWRDKNGWPSLVLFGLKSPKFEIIATGDWSWRSGGLWEKRKWQTLPYFYGLDHLKDAPTLRNLYNDVMPKLRKISEEKHAHVTLSCSYSGLLPDATRDKIAHYKDKFAGMFILAEAHDWKVSIKEIPKPPIELADPLLVGWDKTDLWLVDHFEMTSIERLVASQFTTG